MTAQDTEAAGRARLASRRRLYKGISFGTTLICTGVVLLLNTQGAVGWGVWLDLIRLWPVFLISIGLRLMFVGTRAHAMSLAGPLLVVLAAAWAVSHQIDHDGRASSGMHGARRIDVACPAPPEGEIGRVRMTFAGGDMLMLAGESPAGEGKDGGPGGAIRYDGDVPEMVCRDSALRMGYAGRERRFHVFSPFGRWGNRWDARLTAAGPIAMDVDLAAAIAELDLRAIDVDRIDLRAAVSGIVMRLGPPRRRVPVTIDGAMTTVRIVVPEGTCYRIVRDRALNILHADGASGRIRGSRRITASACPSAAGRAEGPGDPPAYDISFDLPFSRVTVEGEPGA